LGGFLEHNDNVNTWVKNGHIGFFEILYIFNGVLRKYRQDFLIRLTNRKMLILEVKGREDEQSKTKRRFLDEWVQAVNSYGRFGRWYAGVSNSIGDLKGIIQNRRR
jgi:type III restriction enzyme